MSLDHTKTMLKTLKQYHNSEILLTINDNNHLPMLSVCYKNFCYEITFFKTLISETYDDIESAISAIDKYVI